MGVVKGEHESKYPCRLHIKWCGTTEYRCYTQIMPTLKPRYTITDTGEVEAMLDEAQRRWPGMHDRKELLLLLASIGSDTARRDIAAKRKAVEQTAGTLTGIYRRDELNQLREDWPA